MKTVIFKWNPEFSSYAMGRFLLDLADMRAGVESDFNWSVWDHEQIHEGDRFFFVKVGSYGQTGIVGCGSITSDPYADADWSGQNRKTYYVDYSPSFLINPDALPVLSCTELEEVIPDFEWARGHSGLVLTDEQSAKLDELWKQYLEKNESLFDTADTRPRPDDLIFRGDRIRM